jgi:hypothetical protein
MLTPKTVVLFARFVQHLVIVHQNVSSYKLVLGYNQIRKTETPEGHQARSCRKLNSDARKRKHASERKSVINVNNNCFSSSLSDQSHSDVSDDTCSNFDFSDKCNLNRQNGSNLYICQLNLILLKLQHL